MVQPPPLKLLLPRLTSSQLFVTSQRPMQSAALTQPPDAKLAFALLTPVLAPLVPSQNPTVGPMASVATRAPLAGTPALAMTGGQLNPTSTAGVKAGGCTPPAASNEGARGQIHMMCPPADPLLPPIWQPLTLAPQAIIWPSGTLLSSMTSDQPNTLSQSKPDGSTTTSTHEGHLPFPNIPRAACHCHLFPSFRGSLLSIGRLCDAGMTARFTASDVHITTSDGHQVLHGRRTPDLPLWMFDLDTTQPAAAKPIPFTPQAATVTPMSTAKDTVAFLHATMGSPTLSTLEQAVRCAYTRLPGLTTSMLHRHPPNSRRHSQGAS